MKTVNLVALILGAFAFNLIFWEEEIGLNFALFSIFSLVINYINLPSAFLNRRVQITLMSHLIAIFFMLYHHSVVSILASLVSWVVLLGFLHQTDLRTVYRALFSSFINFFKLPPWAKTLRVSDSKFSSFRFERRIRTFVFPVVGLLVFYFIFREANSVFRNLTDTFWSDVLWFFERIFAEISIFRIAFFIFGLMVCSWFIYRAYYTYFIVKEKFKTDALYRIRKVKKKENLHMANPYQKGLSTSLKAENKTGVLMMTLIGILLVFVNTIDVIYVWFGFDYDPNRNYSAEVHKGVNLLIFSIFLSIFIMIYYFRRNQNFYTENVRLKRVAYFWIVQNVLLIVSVIFRNLHYIQHHGLTHKRIGVFVFLCIVFIGLWSLYRKIAKTQSFFYLSKFNSWSLYGILIFLACFNWDMLIFNHNFSHRKSKEIDINYLVDLSDEVILNLSKHRKELEKEEQMDFNDLYSRSGAYRFDYRLFQIKEAHLYDTKSIFSWNYRRVKFERFLGGKKS